MRLNPELRGRGGIGRYLTGLAMREMDLGAVLVALHASPFELREQFEDGDVPDHVWEAGAAALAPVWESLGFHRFDEHLFVLDPARTTLDDAMIALHARISS